MEDIKIFVTWKTLELIVTVEDYDYSEPDEWIPTCGYVEIDWPTIPSRPRPFDGVMKMIQAQFDDDQERIFDRVVEDCSEKIYEDGLVKYAEQQVEAAERYAAERADWLYHLGKESRRVWR